MKIASLTLVHAAYASKVGAALASALPEVDCLLVIDTTPDLPDVREAIGRFEIEHPRAHVIVVAWPWQDSFAAARNFALECAGGREIDWAVMLDADERLVAQGGARAALAALASKDSVPEILLCPAEDGPCAYWRERVFRCPASVRYLGPTHEVPIGGVREPFSFFTFHGAAKSAEAFAAKNERDVAMLEAYVVEYPTDPRWWFYLGQSRSLLGKQNEAIDAYVQCAKLREDMPGGGGDAVAEGSWACFRAAEILVGQGRYDEAIRECAMGLALHAGIAELAWLAGLASFRAGRPAQATAWARMAVAMGCYAGAGKTTVRLGFQHLPALWEGPYDILRFTLPDARERQKAEHDMRAAQKERLAR